MEFINFLHSDFSSFFALIFGLIIGSFLNCLVWRLHTGEGLFNRSYCPKCKKQIAWYDNIPVLSFIILGGRCRHCRKKISWQYPLVEILTGLLFFLSWRYVFLGLNFDIWRPGSIIHNIDLFLSFSLLRYWFLIAVMAVIFIIDLRWFLILDVVTLPACVIIIILNLALGFSWLNLLISGIIGAGFFLAQFLISKGKWIGGGDIRLGLLMGLALGWPNILAAIFLAYFVGSVIGVGLIASGKKKWSSQVPLGVFLSLASIIVLFWGNQLLGWYLSFFS